MRRLAHPMPAGLAAAIALVLLSCLGRAQQQQPDSALNLIRNGDFDENLEGWSQWFAPGQAEGAARWVERDGGGAMAVTIGRRDTRSSVQVFQGPFAVRGARWYWVSFEARAEGPMTLGVSLMRHSPPYAGLGLNADVAVGAEWSAYTLLTRATSDSDDARVDFFPEASFWLDKVSVREAAERPAALPVSSVSLGPGWRGDSSVLTDGNPRTVLSSQYQPVRPLLVTLDLGEERAVAGVLVQAEDIGRYVATERMRFEVSPDGGEWFLFATPVRSAAGESTGDRPYQFLAANVAVPVRYVRIRVTGLRGNARLAEVEVLAADHASPAALAGLARVAPEEDLAFLGWDYDRLGYDASPGEPVALRLGNQGDRQVATSLAWRLQTYVGEELTHGETPLRAGPGETVDVPIELPGDLRDGPYRVRFRVGEAQDEQAFYFDYRVAVDSPLGLRLVALLDNVDPEGWVRMMAGPVAPYVDVRRALPEDVTAVDAVLVMAENWPSDAPQVQALERYLRGGGRAVFFGKVAPSLAAMLPVEIDREDPWGQDARRLQTPSFWPGFDPAAGPRHYPVRVTPRPGAKVLAAWEGGAPAVVEGTHGSGRVLYIGAGPGHVWQWTEGLRGADELALRALFYLTGRGVQADAALSALAEKVTRERRERHALMTDRVAPGHSASAREGASLDNVGRFGWLVEEGGITDNLGADCEMRSPAYPTPWRVLLPERGPLRARPTQMNWLAKRTEWRDERGTAVASTMSLAEPCILWETRERRIEIASDATHVAFAEGLDARVVGRGEEIPVGRMSANWLVLFRADGELRDVPRVVLLGTRPDSLRLGANLELTFPGVEDLKAFWTGSLFGIRRLGPGETAEWVERVPPSVAAQAARLGRDSLQFWAACEEVFWREGDEMVVTTRFRHRDFEDPWGAQPDVAAPLPPMLSLARRHGYPVKIEGEVRDTGIATKYGPLEVVDGYAVRYRLPIPLGDHYGVIPVEGKMDLAEAIDHYGLQGIATVKTASGGLTTSDPYLADLRTYMASGSGPAFESQCIDLYKWWYCFPALTARPAYSDGARETVDAHYREHYWTTLNFYPHKGFVRYRREPWTGLDYTVTFVWPVIFRDGVRYFCDQNESAAVILYCLEMYSRYYGDWTTPASNWNLCLRFHDHLDRYHDWATMASSNFPFFSTVGIDMLNSEYPGNLAFARLARQVGDEDSEAAGLYLAAKAAVPAVARHYMPDYVASITAEGDPWRAWRYYWSFQETGLTGSETIVQRGDTDFILALGCGMLDTSKGTGPEIALLYKQFARDRAEAYERALDVAAEENKRAPGWAHLMQRAILGWPREGLIEAAKRFNAERPDWGWQSTKGPHNLAVVCVADTPLFLADWAPAEYITGRFTPTDRTVRLSLNSREPGPYSIRLYSRWTPLELRVNGRAHEGYSYEAETGWLAVALQGSGETAVEIRLGDKAAAPPHLYFAP